MDAAIVSETSAYCYQTTTSHHVTVGFPLGLFANAPLLVSTAQVFSLMVAQLLHAVFEIQLFVDFHSLVTFVKTFQTLRSEGLACLLA